MPNVRWQNLSIITFRFLINTLSLIKFCRCRSSHERIGNGLSKDKVHGRIYSKGFRPRFEPENRCSSGGLI